MLEINLLPVREARRRADLRQQVMQLVLVLIVTFGGVGLVHSHINDQRERANLRVRQMQQDIKQFEPQLKQVEAFKKKKRALEKKIDVIAGLNRARSGPVRLLSELASKAPERLWLKSLDAKGRTISLKGQSLDNELVALFLSDLKSSKLFEEVDLESTQIGESKSGGLKVVSFEITARLASHKKAVKAKKKNKKGKKGRHRA